MTEKPKYVEIQPRSRHELEADLASDDTTAICDALFSAAQHEPDWRWSQAQCLRMLKHEAMTVRSSAAIALGEIALFRGELDVDLVVSEFQRLASDGTLVPTVEDAYDNIRASCVAHKLPELSEFQLDCLRRYLRFEVQIDTLQQILRPLIVFELEGPATHQTLKYSVGIPKNPIKVTRADIEFGIEKARTGAITQRQLQQWATMILLNDAYEWSGDDENTIADMLGHLSS